MYPNHKGRSPEEKLLLFWILSKWGGGGRACPSFFVTNTRTAVLTREAFPKDKSCGLHKIKKMLSWTWKKVCPEQSGQASNNLIEVPLFIKEIYNTLQCSICSDDHCLKCAVCSVICREKCGCHLSAEQMDTRRRLLLLLLLLLLQQTQLSREAAAVASFPDLAKKN